MPNPIDDAALDQIFRSARTYNVWQDKPVSDATLMALADLLKMGPTSANCSPARVVFVTSDDAKARLKPHLDGGNADKTMAAPATAIIGYDMTFYEHMHELFPHNLEARSWFEGKPDVIKSTAFRNGTLQGAYLIIAARSLGLDCGPMSGFSNSGVDQEFFAGTEVKSNFLCNLGYGDPDSLFPRSPRFDFDKFCSIV
ncbi:MAG: malonic semialdehyde reductase [Pseudomonadota bacterium]